MEFVISDSFANLNVDWVKIDPSRVLQVRQMCVLTQTTADLL
jgi:hypothetical protein